MVIDALIKREYGIDFLVKSYTNIVCQCVHVMTQEILCCDRSYVAALRSLYLLSTNSH